MQKQLFLILSILIVLPTAIHAQQVNETGRLAPTEFSIPPSPVFDLMGVTPSQINRTSDIKDFKVDWSFKSWRLNPNLAIQSQPVWEIFYNRYDLSKYQAANTIMRKLASLDVSLGTVQNEEGDRRIGFAAKMNLVKKKDPLLQKNLHDDIGIRYREEKQNLEAHLKLLKEKLDTTNNLLEKPGIRNEIAETVQQIAGIPARRNNEINERAGVFIAENWNAASLDIAAGRVYTYQSDSAGSLRKLRLNRNTGWGVWLNGGLPLGKKWMLAALLRTTFYEEDINFLLRNTATQEESQASAVAENKIYSAGMNLRYGGPIYSFFTEFLIEKKAVKTPVNALKEVFTNPVGMEIIAPSVKWNVVHPNSFSIGGEWRVSRNVIINYGMRWILDIHWKSQAFIPVAGISCMMR